MTAADRSGSVGAGQLTASEFFVFILPMTLTAVPLTMRRQKRDKLCRGYKILCPRLTEYFRGRVPGVRAGVDAYASKIKTRGLKTKTEAFKTKTLIGINYRRWTRATGCLICIMLYTEVNEQCDKLAKLVGRTLTAASNCQLTNDGCLFYCAQRPP